MWRVVMNSDELVDMIVQQHADQKIAIKQIKIKSIHKDIIRLKQENRNIGDKINSFMKHVSHNNIECTKFYVCGNGDLSYVYKDRINRDFKTIMYLEKLQMLNSMLINKHRSKVKSLRSELQELKKELNDTKKGEIK